MWVSSTHMDPTDPVAILGDHLLLDDLGETGIETFLEVVGTGSGSPLVSAELRQLGGALATPSPRGGVLNHYTAPFACMTAGLPDAPHSAEAILAHCATVRAALRPWDTGRTAPTFVETGGQPQRHLDPDQILAVDRVRARVDPDGLFSGDISANTSARKPG